MASQVVNEERVMQPAQIYALKSLYTPYRKKAQSLLETSQPFFNKKRKQKIQKNETKIPPKLVLQDDKHIKSLKALHVPWENCLFPKGQILRF